MKKTVSKVHRGKPWPLGSSITTRGVNFCVAAPAATHIELLLFTNASDPNPQETIHFKDDNKSGDYWHIEVEGLGLGCFYCYRVCRNAEQGQTDFHNKVLLDPCARAIAGWDIYRRDLARGTSSNVGECLKGVVCERDEFDFFSHPRPKHPWNKSVIYELHVGGFTNSPQSNVKSQSNGTFIGLIEKIPYLLDLGVTTIEVLPIFSFDQSDAPYGLENYWGYSPLNWFTPHQQYIAGKDHLEARNQVRKLVAACHDNGLEVIIDVVYNHTSEGSKEGPTFSWRGLGESTYYHQNQKGDYLDVSGCGNSIAANRPLVRQLILESMRCWANELGVDGFRFDLGIALSRGENLSPLSNPPLFEDIESDPALSDLKLISEPWDCGGLYKLADFPSNKIKTWNGHFRDDLRKFWKGEKDSVWALKDRLTGNRALYKKKASPTNSINFITAHDGFTLYDLVSFNFKHNLANSENNRDGENHNISCNNNIEGPSTDQNLIRIRERQQRNLLASLILSPGIPMLLMGDEVGRSQGGNNNTWCQNNPLGWMIWGEDNCDLSLHQFVKNLLLIRREISEIFTPLKLPNDDTNDEYFQKQNNYWIEWHGIKLNNPDWGHWSHTISYSINKEPQGALMWMGLNAYSKSMVFELPRTVSAWEKILDTSSCPSLDDVLPHKKRLGQETIELESKSLVMLLANEYASRINF